MIVYLVIALILGALVVAFIAGWDAKATYTNLKNVFRGSSPDDYAKITSEEFPAAVVRLWDGCGLGTVRMEKTVYITDATTLNKTTLFAHIKAANMCKSLQSAAHNCGVREDVSFDDIMTPALVHMTCDETQSILSIKS